jgi:type II secretory pathway pseudopilin PulG
MTKINGISLRSKNGFTIVEVLVAFGLLSLLGLVAAGLFQMMTKQQSSIQDKGASGEILTSLSQYLLSDLACQNEYVNKTIPAIGGTASFSVNSFKGLGTVGTLSEGSQINETTGTPFKILKFEISTPAGQTFKPTSNNLFYAQVEIRLQMGKGNLTYAPRILSVPVLVDSTNKIKKCQLAITADQFCSGIGGTYNAANNNCDFNSQCLLMGTYIQFTPSGDASAFTGPRASAADINNPMTGSPSCPPGANRNTQISTYSWTNSYSVDDGKKNITTYNATMTETYFLCQKCP